MTKFTELYQGDRRAAVEYFRTSRGRYNRSLFKWALEVEVGDYIGTCEGCNRKVTEIEPQFVNANYFRENPHTGPETFVLYEVQFTDTNGRWHHCPGGGCAYPAETPKEVTTYFRQWAFNEKREERIRHWHGKDEKAVKKAIADWQKMLKALEAGRPIVDEHGELLPAFDHAGRV